MTPSTAVSGLFSSWATPAIIWPMAASRSVWINCCSMRLASVMSRAAAMMPSICPDAPIQRAGGGAEQAHFAVLALDEVFDAAVRAFSGKHGLEQRAHLLAVLGGHALAQRRANHFLGGEAKQFLRSRADEGVAALAIQGHDQVGKAFHQAARKFLLAVQALLHGAALGDIDERSLVAPHAAAGIANQSGGVQASDRGAIAAAKSDFMAVDRAGQREFALLGLPLFGLDQKIREGMIEHVFATLVAEHSRKARD